MGGALSRALRRGLQGAAGSTGSAPSSSSSSSSSAAAAASTGALPPGFVKLTFQVRTAAQSPSQASVVQSIVESAFAGGSSLGGGPAGSKRELQAGAGDGAAGGGGSTKVTSSSISSPQDSASLAAGSQPSSKAFDPASEENRAYAGVGNSAQASTSYSSPTWGQRLRAYLTKLWGNLTVLAKALYKYINDNLYALITLCLLFPSVMWAITTCYDAPRRAAWLKNLAARGGPKERVSFSFFGCGLCGTRAGWYRQQSPITFAADPIFSEHIIGTSVDIRGPPGGMSPAPEPLSYVRWYDAALALVARFTGWTTWAPPTRPLQDESGVRRMKQMQKTRFSNLQVYNPQASAALYGSGAAAGAAAEEPAFSAASPLGARAAHAASPTSDRKLTSPPVHPSQTY